MIHQLSKRKKILLAVIGPDGSGKSTLISGINRVFSDRFVHIEYFHWRPGIIPDIGVLLGKRNRFAANTIVTDPHGKKAHSQIFSLFSLLYYLSDYWFAYICGLFSGELTNRLVIFDRYSCDLWLDPKRFRIALPDWFLRYVIRFTPQPDIYLILTGDPKQIHLRKPETSTAAVADFIKKLTLFSNYLGRRGIMIDAMKPPSVVLDEAKNAIMGVINTKYPN